MIIIYENAVLTGFLKEVSGGYLRDQFHSKVHWFDSQTQTYQTKVVSSLQPRFFQGGAKPTDKTLLLRWGHFCWKEEVSWLVHSDLTMDRKKTA